ncbi:hypothetical protein JCM15519_04270 [Fundidesulfovibrio butyratiphilus]
MPNAGIKPELDMVIVEKARKCGLTAAIVRAVVLQESTTNTYALRYEPGFFRRYLDGKPMNFVPRGCSVDTERVCRAISWGPMQIMGETARNIGFRGWFPELCVPEVGVEWGCAYLARLRDRFLATGGWEVVVRAYNGGPGHAYDVANNYPAEVLSHIPGGVWPSTEVSHG